MRSLTTILTLAGMLALGSCLESSGRQSESSASRLRLDYLLKDNSLEQQVELGPSGLAMYASPGDRMAGKAEFRLFPEEYEAFRQLSQRLSPEEMLRRYLAKGENPWPEDSLERWSQPALPFAPPAGGDLPLKGLRVALDPGHVAADAALAEWEGKFVKLRPSPQNGQQEIFLLEPNLTLATAHLLREMLEEAGATVMMTRTEPGIGGLGLTYDAWRKEHFQGSLQEALSLQVIDSAQAVHLNSAEATEKEIFSRLFNQLDLRARAHRINDFNPHLTLIIHYNVDVANWMKRDQEGYMPPGQDNYNMAFVPGSFMEGELEQPEDRLAFVRILLSEDWDRSVTLSAHVLRHFTQKLKVPVVPDDKRLNYLDKASLPSGKPGVYARNLTLTRMIKGPLCYGESLCQDHAAEARILSRRDLLVNGMPVSHRVKEVAEAYFEGVRDYVRQQK